MPPARAPARRWRVRRYPRLAVPPNVAPTAATAIAAAATAAIATLTRTSIFTRPLLREPLRTLQRLHDVSMLQGAWAVHPTLSYANMHHCTLHAPSPPQSVSRCTVSLRQLAAPSRKLLPFTQPPHFSPRRTRIRLAASGDRTRRWRSACRQRTRPARAACAFRPPSGCAPRPGCRLRRIPISNRPYLQEVHQLCRVRWGGQKL